MYIFSAAQIKEWDAYTIEHEPISSIDLMERAARTCFNWLQQRFSAADTYRIFCGSGNNGGDGLAIARMLYEVKRNVTVYVLHQKNATADFTKNIERLQLLRLPTVEIENGEDFPVVPDEAIVVDALFGSGLNRTLEDVAYCLLLVAYFLFFLT